MYALCGNVVTERPASRQEHIFTVGELHVVKYATMSMDLTMADVRQLTDALEELIHLQHGKEAIDRPSTGILFNVASYVCRACSRVGKGAVAFWKRFGITRVSLEYGKVKCN